MHAWVSRCTSCLNKVPYLLQIMWALRGTVLMAILIDCIPCTPTLLLLLFMEEFRRTWLLENWNVCLVSTCCDLLRTSTRYIPLSILYCHLPKYICMHACYLIKLYSVLMNTHIIADFEPCVDWPDGDRQDRGQSVICEGPCQRGVFDLRRYSYTISSRWWWRQLDQRCWKALRPCMQVLMQLGMLRASVGLSLFFVG